MPKKFYKALILILVIGVLSACSKLGKKDDAITKDNTTTTHEPMTEDAYQGSKMLQTDNTEDQGIHEESEKTVYEDDQVYCIEKYVYWSDPRAPHPIIEIEHHTYDKKTGEELTILGITGMSSEEAADEIRKQLKENYPFFYDMYWGNSDDYKEYYRDYYNSIDPLTLDFCPNENNEILVYDSWGLPYGDNTNGLEVYVTLHVK